MRANFGQGPGGAKSIAVPGLSGPFQIAEAKSRRRMCTKEQWLALKPLIQRLYIDEGQTFVEVAEFLDRNHEFKPTKKQFLTRVKEWGLQKNVKQGERRAILESLSDRWKEGGFQAEKLRGRRLDKAKIERWRKREGVGSSVAQVELGEALSSGYDEARLPTGSKGILHDSLNLNDETYSTSTLMEACNDNDVEDEVLSERLQQKAMAMDQLQLLNLWSVIDTVGSPRLTGLIRSLTMEVGDDIGDLDFPLPCSEEADDDHDKIHADKASGIAVSHETRIRQTCEACHSRVSSNIAIVSNHLVKERQHWLPGPLDKLCVFPRSGYQKRYLEHPETIHLVSEDSLKMKELECKRKLKALDQLERPELIDLVERMRSIAHRHFELNHDRLSEVWWRRVVTCSLKIQEYRPSKLLYACLQVVRRIHCQGRILEAKKIHQGLHEKIMSLVGPEHELAIVAADTLAYLSGTGEQLAPQVSIYRQLLQICLLRFGPRSTLTLDMLLWLGRALNSCGQVKEAETLLSVGFELHRETSGHADKNVTRVLRGLQSMATLSWSLQAQQKYDDSSKVLENAQSQFRNMLVMGSICCWKYFTERNELLKAKGHQLDYGELLRSCLRHARDTGILQPHSCKSLQKSC